MHYFKLLSDLWPLMLAAGVPALGLSIEGAMWLMASLLTLFCLNERLDGIIKKLKEEERLLREQPLDVKLRTRK